MQRGKITTPIAVAALALYLCSAPTPARAAGDCLVCHGEKGFKDAAGRSIFIDPAKHKASVHGILACNDCHTQIKDYPHPTKIAKVECASCHSQQASELPNSVHAALGESACSACHGNVHEIGPAAKINSSRCAECHAAEVKELASSVHGAAAQAGDKDAPTCFSCHGAVHQIQASSSPTSPVAKKNLPETCAACHSNRDFLSRHNIPFAHPVELYRQSVHGRAIAAGNLAAATCSDCHGSHGILESTVPASPINHWKVAATCGRCHSEIAKTYLSSIHGQAMLAGAEASPVCTDCHGEHLILGPQEAASPVSATRVSSVTCGRCHSDERLEARYNLPADRVPSYATSYHGLALRSGSQTVANCASCHGVHNIFPSSDPRSTVNPANLAHTCGACHAGAGARFAIGPVHVRASSANVHPVVKWIRLIYLVMIPLAIGFMLTHQALDFFAKLLRRHPPLPRTGAEVERMGLHFRIAHWMIVFSFPILVWTGFALVYPDASWAQALNRWEGGISARGALHRMAAVVMVAACVYHAAHLMVSRRDRVILRFMIPVLDDARQFFAAVRYNLGLSDKAPQFGKFSYTEKIEYLAFIWGTLVMTVSGLLLWFNNFALRHFPKWVTDAATAIHFYEAILATFSILIWHFYTVIFDPDVYPMDRTWLTGKASAEHLRHYRPEYYRQLTRASENPPAAGSGEPPEKNKKK